jgi:hypothetical protein
MSVGTGRRNIIILFWKEQFHFREYINGNQTFILDSHRLFICSAGKASFLLHMALDETAHISNRTFPYRPLKKLMQTRGENTMKIGKAKQLTFTLGLKQVVRFLLDDEEMMMLGYDTYKANANTNPGKIDGCTVASQNRYSRIYNSK